MLLNIVGFTTEKLKKLNSENYSQDEDDQVEGLKLLAEKDMRSLHKVKMFWTKRSALKSFYAAYTSIM